MERFSPESNVLISIFKLNDEIKIIRLCLICFSISFIFQSVSVKWYNIYIVYYGKEGERAAAKSRKKLRVKQFPFFVLLFFSFKRTGARVGIRKCTYFT